MYCGTGFHTESLVPVLRILSVYLSVKVGLAWLKKLLAFEAASECL